MSESKKTTKKKPATKKKATTKKNPAVKKTTPKISQKVIQKVEEDATKTRDYQSRFDNKYNIVAYKYNKFPCSKCGNDISLNMVSLFTDPKTDKEYINLKKTCSTSCMHNNVTYELTEISEEQLKKDSVNTFNNY